MNTACARHGHEDADCLIRRLMDEIEQLREENAALRADYEHALEAVNRHRAAIVEALL